MMKTVSDGPAFAGSAKAGIADSVSKAALQVARRRVGDIRMGNVVTCWSV